MVSVREVGDEDVLEALFTKQTKDEAENYLLRHWRLIFKFCPGLLGIVAGDVLVC